MVLYIDRKYDASKCVRIVNMKQASYYIKNGIYPIDMYVGYSDMLVMIFDKDKTKPLFDLWVKNSQKSAKMEEN